MFSLWYWPKRGWWGEGGGLPLLLPELGGRGRAGGGEAIQGEKNIVGPMCFFPSGNTPKKRVFFHGRTSLGNLKTEWQGQALIRLRSDKHAIECVWMCISWEVVVWFLSLILIFSFVKIVFHMSGLLSIVFLVFLFFCAIALLLDASCAAGDA